jgi:hypothetical protein
MYFLSATKICYLSVIDEAFTVLILNGGSCKACVTNSASLYCVFLKIEHMALLCWFLIFGSVNTSLFQWFVSKMLFPLFETVLLRASPKYKILLQSFIVEQLWNKNIIWHYLLIDTNKCKHHFVTQLLQNGTDMLQHGQWRMPSIRDGKEQGSGKPSIERPKLSVHFFVSVSADGTGWVGVDVAVGA